jgi:hypothetical protein
MGGILGFVCASGSARYSRAAAEYAAIAGFIEDGSMPPNVAREAHLCLEPSLSPGVEHARPSRDLIREQAQLICFSTEAQQIIHAAPKLY